MFGGALLGDRGLLRMRRHTTSKARLRRRSPGAHHSAAEQRASWRLEMGTIPENLQCSRCLVRFQYENPNTIREGWPAMATARANKTSFARADYFFGKRKKEPLFDWKFPPSSTEMEARNIPGAHIENGGGKRRRRLRPWRGMLCKQEQGRLCRIALAQRRREQDGEGGDRREGEGRGGPVIV